MVVNESINSLALPSVSLDLLEQLPCVPAIYFCLSASSDVLYIGQTLCLHDRWVRSHHPKLRQCKKLGFTRLAWLAVVIKNDCLLYRRRQLLDVERLFITHFRPPLNWDLPESGETKKQTIETLRRIEQVLNVNFGVDFDSRLELTAAKK